MFDFDFSYDFKDVRELIIKEKLSREELEEGLEPEEMLVKICITDHAYYRMVDTYGRQCEWEDVEDLILQKGHLLFYRKNLDEFAIINAKKTLALICKLYFYKGEMVLVLKTVIRKVIVINGVEVEKRVYISDIDCV